jgi:hypothetical protein
MIKVVLDFLGRKKSSGSLRSSQQQGEFLPGNGMEV